MRNGREGQELWGSFLTASLEEKQAAAKSRIHRTGFFEKEGGREQSVKILHGCLSDLLKADKPGPGRSDFIQELVHKSSQLVSLLRPEIQGDQRGDWRYFYANCPVATEAFKCLSPQKQAWMIFTLMSDNNDDVKLLALSILQDPRLALTRFGSADDRSKKTLASDVYNNSCLAEFFKVYLNEFGGMSEARAHEVYHELTGSDPNLHPHELAQLRMNCARLQLFWLTENSTGRMKALFENDVTVAAKILHNFTVNLESCTDWVESCTDWAERLRLQGISLFRSISSWSQQEKIMQEMEYGHPDKGTKGHRGSSDVLLEMDTPEKIAAVKEGVLHSGNLEALLSKLIDCNTRAFGLLAELLSDSVHGIDYQRAFQKLVNNHYDQLSSNEQITEFLRWLDDCAPDNSDIVRARYAAVMLTETESQYHLHVTLRKNRVNEMRKHFYPTADLLTAIHRMHTAFPSEDEWKARGRIFSLLLQAELINSLDLSQGNGLSLDLSQGNGLQFLSVDGRTDLLTQIVDGFSGDITTDPRIRAEVVSWGDLIGIVIIETCSAHQKYIDQLIHDFCEKIKGITEDHQADNLALVLMNALDGFLLAKDERDLFKYKKMYSIYKALAERRSLKVVTFHPDFDVLDRKLELLGAVRQKQYGCGAKKEKIYACFEGFSLRLAIYLLRRAQEQEGALTANEDRGDAQAIINEVVNNPNSFKRISDLDRLHLGMSINRGYYLTGEIGNPTIVDYKMVCRILYILFSDVRHLDITTGINLLCESAGAGNSGVGIAALMEGIRADELLQENFAAKIEPALRRMAASLIYALYKDKAVLESQRFRLCGQETGQGKLNQITKIQGVLRSAGLVSDVSNNESVDIAFATGTLLHRAFFDELGLKDFANTIRDEIKRQNSLNNRMDHTTHSSTERTGLLVDVQPFCGVINNDDYGSSFV